MNRIGKPKIVFRYINTSNSNNQNESEKRITQVYNRLFTKAYKNIKARKTANV